MLDDTTTQDQSQEESKITEEPTAEGESRSDERKEPEAENTQTQPETPDAPASTEPQTPVGEDAEPELAPPPPAIVEAEKAAGGEPRSDSEREEANVKSEPITSESVSQDVSEPVGQKVSDADQKKDEKITDSTDITDTPTDKLTDSPTTDADRLAPNSPPAGGTTPTLTPSGPKARWYVVHTYSGHEAKVAATLKQRVTSQKLEDKVLDIMVPTQDKIEIREGKKARIKEKIFPGYLLIKMVLDDNTWLIVRTTPGITSFVGMGNRPTPLPEEEVNTIQKYMTMEAPKFKASFSVSEAVKITDGPFSEFLGSISEIDDARGKLKVLVSIFGRETPVELDFLQVAKL